MNQKRSYSKAKKSWQEEHSEGDIEEEEDLELVDLLERLLASQKELFVECQKLKESLSLVQQQLTQQTTRLLQ